MDDDLADAELHSTLGARLHRTTDPPPGYSIATRIHEKGRLRPGVPLGVLSHGRCPVLRSRSASRLTASAAAHVLCRAQVERPVLLVRYAIVATEHRCVLIEPELLWTPGVEAHLRGVALRIHDAPFVALHPEDHTSDELIWWRRDDHEFAHVPGAPSAVISTTSTSATWPASAAGAVASLAARLVPSTLDPQARLESARALAERARTVVLHTDHPARVAEAIGEHLRS